MAPNVPSNDSGTEILGMIVAQTLRRKTKTTRMTNAIEIKIVYSISAIEARIVVVRSTITERWTAGGIEAFSCASSAYTLSTVWIILAAGCFETLIRTAGMPLASPM